MQLKTNRCSRLSIPNLLVFVAILFAAKGAQAATYTVTNTNNSGAGSLRQAMTDANNNTDEANTIVFNIPGSGVRTITPLSELPFISGALVIDATTQPGYNGAPLIEINATNVANGLYVENCKSWLGGLPVTIKGLIINRASVHGIYIDCAAQATITGNYIGTNSTGTTDLGNGADGVHIQTLSTTSNFNLYGVKIGGAAANERNVISGNNRNGIQIRCALAADCEIYNNFIGTNAAGTADLGNSEDGITVSGSVRIGGTGASPFNLNLGNVISGNNGNGISLGAHYPSIVQRNYIGTNAAGTAVLGNGANGIYIRSAGAATKEHLIGSSTNSLDDNVISGNGGGGVNDGDGIKIENVGGVQIFGNKIGTNSAGTADLGNLRNGIELINASDTQIGLAGNNTARNIIAGNNLHGILLSGAGSTGNLIRNNFIGTNASNANLGNNGDGINIAGVSQQTAGLNQIGGNTSNAGNTIAYNKNGNGINIATASTGNIIRFNTIHSNLGSGVSINSSSSGGNTVRQNSIYSNQGLGINLGVFGVTPNDLNDADAGANNLQNFPVLQSATSSRLAGSLNSASDQDYVIDFYRVDSCDVSGHGQGRYFLTSFNVTTVGNNADFNIAFSGLTAGQFVTATATDANGNTSEFSQCRLVSDSGDFQLSSANYNVTENGGFAIVTVNRIGSANDTITVDYATSNGTAIAGQDYTPASGTLTFLNGETTKTFSVSVTNETKYEPEETFNVSLSNPTGGALLLSPSSAVISISDNDSPPTISITDVNMEEGGSGTTNFIFTVNLSEPSGFDAAISYNTANGTATAGNDYAAASGALNFSSALNETSKTVAIAVSGDTTSETNETFFVYLSNPVNATVSDAQGIGTIMDDDNPGKLQFQMSPYYTNENTSVLITVLRMGGDAGTITVDYATGGGTATPSLDYTPASGTLIFNDGETTKSFSVPILADTEAEGQETFNISLSNPLGGATLGALSSTVINIGIPTAASVSVDGRVTTADGRGIRNALVTLAAPNGETRTALTGAFGYYRFTDVRAGETYVLTVVSKRFQFAPQVVSVAGDINELNFTAND
ncbi:MAG: carboxypeptidase regulatory-like domain-containing protein [Acidobacteriota bacterium]|nr:carboxypeptidase regulatory-like domain-containing protein [Acidobacteriota bacterium]